MTIYQKKNSFSNQKDYSLTVLSTNSSDDNGITVLGPNDLSDNVFPLTEENLAIHTNSVSNIYIFFWCNAYLDDLFLFLFQFPPSREARRRQVRLFVEDQRPVVKMYLILEKQRTQEIESFIPDELPDIKFIQQGTTKNKTWLKRLTHWIHKRRNRGHHDICQKRDSGISFFSKHHSTRSSRIATVRQQNNDFAAYKYPKMVRNLLNHADTISA